MRKQVIRHAIERSGVRKHVRIFAGFVMLLIGIILAIPAVPGPGIPFIIGGLVLLSDHFTWARRTLAWSKEKWRHIHQKMKWPGSCAENTGKDGAI